MFSDSPHKSFCCIFSPGTADVEQKVPIRCHQVGVASSKVRISILRADPAIGGESGICREGVGDRGETGRLGRMIDQAWKSV
jgi:hypothetical protein